MTNQKQRSLLQQDVRKWNCWRQQHLNDTIDLRGADLSGSDLRFADLTAINLSEANLSKTNLSGTNLCQADLTRVNLSEANLSGERWDRDTLEVTYPPIALREATLSEANLNKADLRRADLSFTQLNGANLNEARIAGTNFGDRDFRFLKGLETIKHEGPSPLSINSIYLSEGDIPEAFVRGTGAPDTFIEYMHALAAKPIEYYTCFLSYSHNDEEFAKRLYNDLQGNGVRCWFAPEELKGGDFYRHKIDESIRLYDKVLLLLSEHSVKSKWVEEEVEKAWKKEDQQNTQALFPIRLDDAVMKTERRWASQVRFLRHIENFTGWKDYETYQCHFQRLLDHLQHPKQSSLE